MRSRFGIQIRNKILIGILVLLTVAVGVITFTMASLFHEDKKAYINDLTATVTLTTAEETQSLLVSYLERLHAYARIMRLPDSYGEEKEQLLRGFFEDFPDLVAVSLYQGEEAIGSVHDAMLLEEVGLAKADLDDQVRRYPLPLTAIRAGEIALANVTLTDKMPMMTLATATGDGDSEVVSAFIRLDRLQEIATRSNVFELFILDHDGAVLAHRDPTRLADQEQATVANQARMALGNPAAGLIREYELDGEEMIGGFLPVDFGGMMIVAQTPKSVAYLAARDLLDRLLLVALALLAAAALGSLAWAHGISRPLERLWSATREIAKGDFDVQVEVRSSDEIGKLSGAFNNMASELKSRETALTEAHAQLIQSEKLAAFGQIGAGIAHEVKNPMTGILGCAQLVLQTVEPDSDIRQDIELIEKETKRCKSIIENLLRFARQEKAVFEPTAMDAVIEDAVTIVRHQLELQQVKVETRIESGLPKVNGNHNQLQQVIMNIIMNAQQAMEGEPGRVTVEARVDEEDRIEVRIRDTGPGIPQEHLDRLFEPFFTTKPGGKGTGLGLSVSFGIIEDHRGEIAPENRPDGGAIFVIRLPVLRETMGSGPEESNVRSGEEPAQRSDTAGGSQ